MMILQLSRGNGSLRVPLRLPCTPEDAGEAFAKLDTISMEQPTQIKEVICPDVPNIRLYIRRAVLDSGSDMDKLNILAERIGDMSEKEHTLFAGALDGTSINGIDDVLRVSEHLSDYLLIPNVTSVAELGRFVAVSGRLHNDPRFPEEALPYLDFMKVGTEYYSGHGGAFTTQGYVLLKSSADIHQSEPEPWRDESRDEIILLTLQSSNGGYLLALPADDEYLDDVARHLKIDDFAMASISQIAYSVPYLADLLPEDGINVEDANELALSIEEMQQTDGELLKYCSVLAAEQPETFGAAFHLAQRLDEYDRVPDDPAAYGKHVLEQLGADEDILDTIDGYMDFESFGEFCMKDRRVIRTEFGLIARKNPPFDAQQYGMGGMSL